MREPTRAVHKGSTAQDIWPLKMVSFKQEAVHVNSQENKQSYWERNLGKRETHVGALCKKRRIQELDARVETEEEFRNVLGFRKASAPLELTLAREFKATATGWYSFSTVKAETKMVCGHC